MGRRAAFSLWSPRTSLRIFETHWRPRLPSKYRALQRPNETPRRKHFPPHIWVSLFARKDKAPGEEFVAWLWIWYKGCSCVKVIYGPVNLSSVWLRVPQLTVFYGTVCLYVAKVHLECDIPPPQYSRSWDISKHYHVQLVCLIFDLQVEHREVFESNFQWSMHISPKGLLWTVPFQKDGH